ncbi:hypothetical protein HPB49_025273 [Dermacentor silvarum]|uniref:Uncharacterized protein n=1 Tax=Dermacentor silvarum TaxID=543639 RepID=A0ACB8CNL9_DERSI|nr:hypothetical protein HPB49_025273 [Dermacentor silvarum]
MFSAYRVYVVAKTTGDDVVRLPSHHCEFNPIELIWSRVKAYVAAYTATFTPTSVAKLLHENINLVTADTWLRACAHVQKIEEECWQRDSLIDASVDQLLISLGSDSSSESDASDNDTSGVEELM